MDRSLIRVLGVLLCAALAPAVARAQPANPDQGAPRPSAGAFIDRFNAANTTGDGRLTRAQARAGHLAFVVRHFAEIDDGQRGYVTLADIDAYRRAHPPQHTPQAAAAAPAPIEPAPRSQGAPGGGAAAFVARFQKANTTGDGRLTLAQAQTGHMTWLANNFDAIDQAHHGYVTLADVQAFRSQQRSRQRQENEIRGSAIQPPT